MGSGPDPNNIVLILRTQSILFDRYSEELQPYKYAGYPMLIKTIKFESEDSELFSKVSLSLWILIYMFYKLKYFGVLHIIRFFGPKTNAGVTNVVGVD